MSRYWKISDANLPLQTCPLDILGFSLRCSPHDVFPVATSARSLQWEGFCGDLRLGWVFLERTWILSGIQFTTQFIDFLCCGNETIRRYFCTRDLGAENLRPALEQGCGKQTPSAMKLFIRANWLYVPISKFRGDWDLGLCKTSGPVFRELQRSGDFRKKTCFDARKIGFCHCAAVLQMQVPKLCADLDFSLLYILIWGTYSKFVRKMRSNRKCSRKCVFSIYTWIQFRGIVYFPIKSLYVYIQIQCFVITWRSTDVPQPFTWTCWWHRGFIEHSIHHCIRNFWDGIQFYRKYQTHIWNVSTIPVYVFHWSRILLVGPPHSSFVFFSCCQRLLFDVVWSVYEGHCHHLVCS